MSWDEKTYKQKIVESFGQTFFSSTAVGIFLACFFAALLSGAELFDAEAEGLSAGRGKDGMVSSPTRVMMNCTLNLSQALFQKVHDDSE